MPKQANAKPCKKCNQPALAGNYGFCAVHRDPQRRRAKKRPEEPKRGIDDSDATLVDSTFQSSFARSHGGYLSDSQATIVSSTFASTINNTTLQSPVSTSGRMVSFHKLQSEIGGDFGTPASISHGFRSPYVTTGGVHRRSSLKPPSSIRSTITRSGRRKPLADLSSSNAKRFRNNNNTANAAAGRGFIKDTTIQKSGNRFFGKPSTNAIITPIRFKLPPGKENKSSSSPGFAMPTPTSMASLRKKIDSNKSSGTLTSSKDCSMVRGPSWFLNWRTYTSEDVDCFLRQNGLHELAGVLHIDGPNFLHINLQGLLATPLVIACHEAIHREIFSKLCPEFAINFKLWHTTEGHPYYQDLKDLAKTQWKRPICLREKLDAAGLSRQAVQSGRLLPRNLLPADDVEGRIAPFASQHSFSTGAVKPFPQRPRYTTLIR